MTAQLAEVIASAEKGLHVLKRHVRVTAAYLFGSQAEGTADKDSDIDLAAFIEGAEEWDLDHRVDVAVSVQQEAGDDIELHIFSGKALTDSEPASFATWVKKHGVKLDV